MGTAALARDLEFCQGADLWVDQAMQDVVVRSAPGSLASAKSALRGWAAFADQVLEANGRHLPPTTKGLAAWSQCFRRADTFGNYVAYVKLGCHMLGLSTDEVEGPLLKRARMALKKREAAPKEKKNLRADMLSRLMMAAQHDKDKASEMLYLAAYLFLLRVPSEGLGITVGVNPEGPLDADAHSCVAVVGNSLVLKLARRKNKAHGSTLRRACACPASRWMCPVHTLGEWLGSQAAGTKPFAHLRADVARRQLRERLTWSGVKDAPAYSLHDFRRGHAMDLASAGGTLKTILAAGEWTSPAFLKYLDIAELEEQAVLQAHVDDSDGSEDE